MGNTCTCRVVNATQQMLNVKIKGSNERDSILVFEPNQVQKLEVPNGLTTVSVFDSKMTALPSALLTADPSKTFIIKDGKSGIHVVASSFLPKLCQNHKEDINHYFECLDWTKNFSLTNAVYSLLLDFDNSDDQKRFSKINYQKELQKHVENELPKRIVKDFVEQITLRLSYVKETIVTVGVTAVPAVFAAALGTLVMAEILAMTAVEATTVVVMTASGPVAASSLSLSAVLAATGIGLAIGAVLGTSIFVGINLSWSREEVLKDLTEKIVQNFPQTAKERLSEAYRLTVAELESATTNSNGSNGSNRNSRISDGSTRISIGNLGGNRSHGSVRSNRSRGSNGSNRISENNENDGSNESNGNNGSNGSNESVKISNGSTRTSSGEEGILLSNTNDHQNILFFPNYNFNDTNFSS